MNNNIIAARRKAATIAQAYLEEKITWRQFMDSFADIRDDKIIDELIDIIEHEPKRGGFMGSNEKEWKEYQTAIKDIISQLEKGANEVLLRYSDKNNVNVRKTKDSTTLTFTKADLMIEVDVPDETLEWVVTVKYLKTNEEVLTDWMDHYAVNGETKSQLEIDRDEEIRRLLQAIVDTNIRITYVPMRRWFFWTRLKPIMEHETAEGWQKVLPF